MQNKNKKNLYTFTQTKMGFQLYVAHFTVAVLHLCLSEGSISTVSSCYNGACEGFWQAHYSTPSNPIPLPKYLFSLPDRPVSIRYQKLQPLPAEYFR